MYYRRKRIDMKKIFALMLAAALALSLVACGGGNNAQDSTSAKGSEKTKEELSLIHI